MRILLIDNYDSFTFNLKQLLLRCGSEMGLEVVIRRNDKVDLNTALELASAGLVISPGPGGIDDGGITLELLGRLKPRVPVLGICLGHQLLLHSYGAVVAQLKNGPVHGKTSEVYHCGHELFSGVPSPIIAARYHSLAVEKLSLNQEIIPLAETADGVLMAARVSDRPWYGIQFHPESFLCQYGEQMIFNFLKICRAAARIEVNKKLSDKRCPL